MSLWLCKNFKIYNISFLQTLIWCLLSKMETLQQGLAKTSEIFLTHFDTFMLFLQLRICTENQSICKSTGLGVLALAYGSVCHSVKNFITLYHTIRAFNDT